MKKTFLLFLTLLIVSCSDSDDTSTPAYPDIKTFNTSRSDQFLVDLDENVVDGHMFRGHFCDVPHSGAHINFINNSGGSVFPSDTPASAYPAIYAVADGTITLVEPYYAVNNDSDTHYRYGIYLTFATSGTDTISMQYSIEPMVDPGDESFYSDFITVSVGDTVSKGDIIGYMYLSTDASIGTDHHIHFSLKNNSENHFAAPAIFTPTVMDNFLTRIAVGNEHNYEGGKETGASMSNCMGYEISGPENPYSASAEACLE